MPVKTKFTPRKLMELAIEVTRQSVSELRADCKTSPLIVLFAHCVAQKALEAD
jgi:hypothetical protein